MLSNALNKGNFDFESLLERSIRTAYLYANVGKDAVTYILSKEQWTIYALKVPGSTT